MHRFEYLGQEFLRLFGSSISFNCLKVEFLGATSGLFLTLACFSFVPLFLLCNRLFIVTGYLFTDEALALFDLLHVESYFAGQLLFFAIVGTVRICLVGLHFTFDFITSVFVAFFVTTLSLVVTTLSLVVSPLCFVQVHHVKFIELSHLISRSLVKAPTRLDFCVEICLSLDVVLENRNALKVESESLREETLDAPDVAPEVELGVRVRG